MERKGKARWISVHSRASAPPRHPGAGSFSLQGLEFLSSSTLLQVSSSLHGLSQLLFTCSTVLEMQQFPLSRGRSVQLRTVTPPGPHVMPVCLLDYTRKALLLVAQTCTMSLPGKMYCETTSRLL